MAHAHHHGHGHSHDHPGNEGRVALAALLTGGFMLAEVVGGVVSGSLALLADAGHMLTDFASLALAWFGFRIARRPADWRHTYGFDRFSVLAAFVNGVSLVAIAIWITVEAIQRLITPGDVLGGLMLGVAAVGLAVNIGVFAVLIRGDRENLNMRAALLHVVGDLLGSVAAIVAALIIMSTGWTPADPLLSVLVAALILRSAVAVLRDSGRILLEGTPPGIDAREIARALTAAVPGVTDIRHLHAWAISEDRPMLTLEAVLAEGTDPDRARDAIKAHLAAEHGIDHATVETIAPAHA